MGWKMPSEKDLSEIKEENLVSTISSILLERGRTGMLLAIVVIFECMVVLASKYHNKKVAGKRDETRRIASVEDLIESAGEFEGVLLNEF